MQTVFVSSHSEESESFMRAYYSTQNQLAEHLNVRRHRVSDSASYRLLNYWEKEGLLSCERETENGWRKFSLIDLMWLQLSVQLRTLGFPIEGLKKLKSNFTDNNFRKGIESFGLLEVYTAMVVAWRVPAFFLVLPNGECLVVTSKEIKTLEQHKILTKTPYITVSINHLLSIITKKDWYAAINDTELTAEEFELLTTLRTGNYVSALIHFEKGKPDRIDLTKIESTDMRLIDLVKKHKHQKIELIAADGKVVKQKITTSKKLRK
jgi:DNA-binding transcriptional MerR regulator